ncbi:MAG TPA: hypothetical protein VEF34_02200 [Syntrophobacteraceae bacterium]|nr:hypothetical protein [Syntrophobacteraceae bacterium]
MIELKSNGLVFSFPEVHPEAVFRIDFMRTLRIPDDGSTYFLPPGLGTFPLRHVDDFLDRVPSSWIAHGGVMLPMYQAEALWLSFNTRFESPYPFLIRIGTGKINAVTGKPWSDRVGRNPQDYMVAPKQLWLDGYCVEKGQIRQFVAMPLGRGYSVEEQITGRAEYGGLQIVAHPMKGEAYEAYREAARKGLLISLPDRLEESISSFSPSAEMGVAPGGRMKQAVYHDPYRFEDWDLNHRSRCFVHIANSVAWKAMTGEVPPTEPPTAEQYNRLGLPWFDCYDADMKALDGATALRDLRSVARMSAQKAETVLPDNTSFHTGNVVTLKNGESNRLVREGIV